MKAIAQDTYGSADVLELKDMDKPVPKDNEVLVNVEAAGVDAGVWHLMTGLPRMIPSRIRPAETQGPRPGRGSRRAR
jgi:NADPH:quinone reductase-like Zn-dependent oxidoreductase